MEKILKLLFDKQDLKYRDFQAKLIPNIQKESIIGVRSPDVRAIGKRLATDKEFFSDDDRALFLSELPHTYMEENSLHAALISSEKKDFKKLIFELEAFLPYIDNWAVCDTIHPPLFKKHCDEVLVYTSKWLNSDEVYTVRFGVDMLLANYLDEAFTPNVLETAACVHSDEYYINMALAWFFSFALIKQYDTTVKLFEDNRLGKWVHNKSIQKAVESYRISDERKQYLKTLKIK